MKRWKEDDDDDDDGRGESTAAARFKTFRVRFCLYRII